MSEKLSEVGRGEEKGSRREVQTWRVRVSSHFSYPSPRPFPSPFPRGHFHLSPCSVRRGQRRWLSLRGTRRTQRKGAGGRRHSPLSLPPPLPQAESLEGGVEGRPGSSVRVLRSLRRIAQGGHTRAGGETGREGGGPKEPPTEREKGHLSRGRRGEGGRGEGGGGFVLRYCLCLSCKSVSVFLYVRIDL